jgi:hypothetical protein
MSIFFISPFALFYVDFGTLFAGVFGVVVLLFIVRVQIFGDFPELLGPQLERAVLLRLVPEDLLLQLVGFRIVVNDQALKILGALVHHLAEALKCGEHARVVLVDAFAIGNVGFAQDKHVINVRAQIGRNAERILHCDDQHDLPMTPVHEEEAHHDVLGPFVVIQAVIQHDEGAGVNGGAFIRFNLLFHLLEDGLLALEDVFDDGGIISVVDEEFGDVGGEEAVSGLRARYDGADGDVLVVEHEVLDEETFTRVTAADEDNDGALIFIRPKADGAHVKFGQF